MTEWLAILGAAFTALCTICGGVWWMSSLYFQVSTLVRTAQETKNEITAMREEQERAHDKLWAVMQDHERRIDVLERTTGVPVPTGR